MASTLVGVSVLNVTSADVQARIEGRFVDLANEREKQIEMEVARQYAVANQVAARTRLRELLPRLLDEASGRWVEGEWRPAVRLY